MNFRLVSVLLAIPLVFLVTISLAQSPSDDSKKILIAEVIQKYELDTLSTLMSRVKQVPKELEQILSQYGKFHPISYMPVKSEREQLERAFSMLPVIYLNIIRAHVRSISFVDSISLRALTYTVNRANYGIYDIVINRATLSQDVSTWLTNKERTCFESGNSPLSVSFQAGSLDAIVYVLMHETTHVVDDVLRLTEAGSVYFEANKVTANAFNGGIWMNRSTLALKFRHSILDSTRFRLGQVLPIDSARSVYTAFEETPFVSLYSMFSLSEDVADLFTVYYLTQHLSQPYVIEIKNKGRVIFSYEPAKSPSIKERFKYAALVIGRN
jgi:hypothetical protein